MIWAEDLNGGIGLNGKLPWHIPADLKYFKEQTMGHTLIMGRITFENMPGKLPGRDTKILTRNKQYVDDIDVNDVLDLAKSEDVYIVGGKSVYETFMPYADKLLVTYIDNWYETDTKMKRVDPDEFEMVNVIENKEQQPQLLFATYERKEK